MAPGTKDRGMGTRDLELLLLRVERWRSWELELKSNLFAPFKEELVTRVLCGQQDRYYHSLCGLRDPCRKPRAAGRDSKPSSDTRL